MFLSNVIEYCLIAEKDLNPEQQKLITTFREVFPKMVRAVEVPKQPKVKKL